MSLGLLIQEGKLFNVRRLVALDMGLHGPRFILIEFGLGVPVDRLKTLVERLCLYGLSKKSTNEDEVRHGVTPRGLEFSDTYFRMKGFFEEFGESSSG